MKLKVKREELFSLDKALEGALSLKDAKAKFKIKALRNKRLLAEEIEDVRTVAQSVIQSSPDYQEFQEKRIELCKEEAELDEEENPVIEDVLNDKGNVVAQQYKIVEENKEKFEEKLEALTKEYETVIASYEEKDEEVKKLLAEEIELELLTFSEDLIPESIDSESLDLLLELIE